MKPTAVVMWGIADYRGQPAVRCHWYHNALGGNSIVLGDNDTGFKQNGTDTGYIREQPAHRSCRPGRWFWELFAQAKEKKLSLTSNNNSTMTATFNLAGRRKQANSY